MKKTKIFNTIPDKLQPHNVEAEEALLGSLLIDPDAFIRIDYLPPDCFYIERNAWIIRAIVDLKGTSDLVVLSDELKRRGQLEELGGPARLSELINATPTSSNVEYYAAIVLRDWARRKLIEIAGKIAQLAYEDSSDSLEAKEIIEKATALLLDLLDSLDKGQSLDLTYAEIIQRIQERIEHLQENPEALFTLSTGLSDVDRMLRGGLKPGYYVVAGDTHMGKTLYAMNIAETVATAGRSVLVFSMEMTPEQIVERSLEGLTQFDTGDKDLTRYLLDRIEGHEATWSRFMNASDELSRLPVRVVSAGGLTPLRLLNKAKKYIWQDDTTLIIVDYIQLMDAGVKKDNRNQELAYISRKIKEMTLPNSLNLPIMVLSQLNRGPSTRPDHRPRMSDLRDSGRIEEDADVVQLLFRDEYYNPDTEFPNITEVIQPKNRLDGITGSTSLYFKTKEMKFVDLEVHRQPLEY